LAVALAADMIEVAGSGAVRLGKLLLTSVTAALAVAVNARASVRLKTIGMRGLAGMGFLWISTGCFYFEGGVDLA
jgi:hypothetical protein